MPKFDLDHEVLCFGTKVTNKDNTLELLLFSTLLALTPFARAAPDVNVS